MLVLNIKELTGDMIINIGGDIEISMDEEAPETVEVTGPVGKIQEPKKIGRPLESEAEKKLKRDLYAREYYKKHRKEKIAYAKKYWHKQQEAKKALASKA